MPQFDAPKDLLDLFWVTKQRACDQHAQRPVRFSQVVYRLARRMSDDRRLSVPPSVLDADGLAADAAVLASQHVVRLTPRDASFFHEAFFDYAFAREWVTHDDNLVSFLLDGEQELFRRGQVRQVLLHLHDADPARFVRELEALLAAPRIRFHLKQVAIGVLGSLTQPSAATWAAAERAIADAPSEFAVRVKSALRTPGWFDRLAQEGVIAQWMGDPAMRDRAIGIIAGAVRDAPDRVARILAAHRDTTHYDEWLRDAVRFAHLPDSRELFDLLLDSVRRGAWDPHDQALWMYTDGLESDRPEWAVELLAAFLVERPAALTVADGRLQDLTKQRNHRAVDLAATCAVGAPRSFWTRLGPWMRAAMAATAEGAGARPIRDHHFTSRSWPVQRNDPHRGLDEAMLAASAAALRALAAGDPALPPDETRALLQPLADDPHDAAQWLLYEALAAAGAALADWAGELLLEGPARLRCGYRGSECWATRDLLLAITPHLSTERLAAIEQAILRYRHPTDARDRRGQQELLDGLPVDRLSAEGRRRKDELHRLYGDVTPPRMFPRIGGVRSPVPPEAAARHDR